MAYPAGGSDILSESRGVTWDGISCGRVSTIDQHYRHIVVIINLLLLVFVFLVLLFLVFVGFIVGIMVFVCDITIDIL